MVPNIEQMYKILSDLKIKGCRWVTGAFQDDEANPQTCYFQYVSDVFTE